MGLLLSGAFVLLTLSFSLGFVVAERQAAGDKERAAAPSEITSAGGFPRREREATVRITPATGPAKKPGAAKERVQIDPSFYQELLKEDKPAAEALAPLKLFTEPLAAPPKETATKEPGGKSPPSAKTDRTASHPREQRPRFTIQVLSVQEPARAIRILRGLRDKGFSAFIQRVDLRERGVWLRIRVGRFPDRDSAARILQSLRAKTTAQRGQIVPL